MKRKLGDHFDAESSATKVRERKRQKTYQTIMHINNMIKSSTGLQLNDFVVPRDETTGQLQGNPFDWRHSNLAPDMGPDNVCLDHFLTYKVGMNLSIDYDVSHNLANCTKQALKTAPLLLCFLVVGSPVAPELASAGYRSRQAHWHGDCSTDASPRRCFDVWWYHGVMSAAHLLFFSTRSARNSGLWKWQVVMVSAQNACHGSTLSPPRQAQIREAVKNHLAANTVNADALFQLHWPLIKAGMEVLASDRAGSSSFCYGSLGRGGNVSAKVPRVFCHVGPQSAELRSHLVNL